MKNKLGIINMLAILNLLVMLTACSSVPAEHNTLSEKEKKDGWVLLFDGKSTSGWHLFNKGIIASAWSADSGNLVCNPHAKNVKHGDLVTDKSYKNFELVFDWKISTAGNSGVFINVQELPAFATTFSTGPEYQLLDDKNVEPAYLKESSHKAAAIFGVVANNTTSIPNTGWNHSRILQQNGKVTFWLNEEVTIQVDFNSEEWKKQVAASSMNKFTEFGKAIEGHIAVQDWTNGVSFRDIKIKEL